MPCTKQTILAKVKKVRQQKEDEKVNKIQAKLKKAVDGIMVETLDKFQAECKRKSELRQAALEKANGEKPEHSYKNPKRKFPWTDDIR